MTCTVCPHCGFNLEQDKEIRQGDWVLQVSRTWLRGVRVGITTKQSEFLYALAKANGVTMTPDALGNRLGCKGDAYRAGTAYAHQIRKILGKDSPIETHRAHGFRWGMSR